MFLQNRLLTNKLFTKPVFLNLVFAPTKKKNTKNEKWIFYTPTAFFTNNKVLKNWKLFAFKKKSVRFAFSISFRFFRFNSLFDTVILKYVLLMAMLPMGICSLLDYVCKSL